MYAQRVSSTLSVCLLAAMVLAFTGIAGGAHAASAASSPASPRIVPATSFRNLKWEELVPKGWDPAEKFRARAAGIANDNDPRAWKLMKEYRVALDNAPTIGGLDGAAVRIPGYVVPLDTVNGALKEFLLVPYFGACIHVPPPPSNQVILVRPDKLVPGFRTMDTVWIKGTLHVARQETFAGTSGYTVDAVAVEPYVGEPHN